MGIGAKYGDPAFKAALSFLEADEAFIDVVDNPKVCDPDCLYLAELTE